MWRRNRDYQHVAHIMLVVGALGAIAAAFLGWFAGGFYLTDRNPILMTLAISIQGFLGGTFMHGGIYHLAF